MKSHKFLLEITLNFFFYKIKDLSKMILEDGEMCLTRRRKTKEQKERGAKIKNLNIEQSQSLLDIIFHLQLGLTIDSISPFDED